jgi:hypothetical protein
MERPSKPPPVRLSAPLLLEQSFATDNRFEGLKSVEAVAGVGNRAASGVRTLGGLWLVLSLISQHEPALWRNRLPGNQGQRLADAQRSLQEKATKKAPEEERIATSTIEDYVERLGTLRSTQPLEGVIASFRATLSRLSFARAGDSSFDRCGISADWPANLRPMTSVIPAPITLSVPS